jgi:hypothetical protein
MKMSEGASALVENVFGFIRNAVIATASVDLGIATIDPALERFLTAELHLDVQSRHVLRACPRRVTTCLTASMRANL